VHFVKDRLSISTSASNINVYPSFGSPGLVLMDVSNHAAAAGGNNGFQGEPTSATHATVYATAYSDVSSEALVTGSLATHLRRIELRDCLRLSLLDPGIRSHGPECSGHDAKIRHVSTFRLRSLQLPSHPQLLLLLAYKTFHRLLCSPRIPTDILVMPSGGSTRPKSSKSPA